VTKLLAVGLALIPLSVLPASTAQEPPRFALLIGNEGYADAIGKLVNPHNDIKLVGDALRKLHFTVTDLPEGNYKGINTALQRHIDALRRAGPGAVSLVYYSGHGTAKPNTTINYLIPVDVEKPDDDLWYSSIPLKDIVEKLDKQANEAIHFVIFDACRNELKIPSGKGIGDDQGFARESYPGSMIVAYATAEGKKATDRGEGGGTYARTLAEELGAAGIDSIHMFIRVAQRVRDQTGQMPYLTMSAPPEFYFAGKPEEGKRKEAISPLEICQQVASNDSAAVLGAMLEIYKESQGAGCIRARLEEVRRRGGQETGTVIPAPKSLVVPVKESSALPPQTVISFRGLSEPVRSIAFSPDRRHVPSGGQDRTLNLWNAKTRALERSIKGHSEEVLSVAFSPDSSSLLSISADRKLNLWDKRTGKLIRTFEGHIAPVTSAAFSPMVNGCYQPARMGH